MGSFCCLLPPAPSLSHKRTARHPITLARGTASSLFSAIPGTSGFFPKTNGKPRTAVGPRSQPATSGRRGAAFSFEPSTYRAARHSGCRGTNCTERDSGGVAPNAIPGQHTRIPGAEQPRLLSCAVVHARVDHPGGGGHG